MSDDRPRLTGDWRGRVAIVTGSTQGIGAAIARRLAEWGAAGIVITGRDAARGAEVKATIEARGTPCVFVAADLADLAACPAILAAAEQNFGRLDGLVNAAALSERGGLLDADAALFDKLFAVNVRAPLLLMQGAARLMIAGGHGGAIVNIQSINAHVGHENLTVYAASKGALSTLTRNAAHSLRRHRIRVNGVNLGWADTPAEHAIQRREHPAGEGWLQVAEAAMPFGRLIKVEDVADLAAFLLSAHAGIMTGAVIDYEQWLAGAPP